MNQEIALIFAELKRISARLETVLAPEPKAVKRREAARLMGIGVTKLDQLIAAKKVHTTEDARLVPMSEVRRYCEPKTPRQRKPSVGHRVRNKHIDQQSDEAIADMKRALRAK